jgi:uncharacterized membrane-anchored protein
MVPREAAGQLLTVTGQPAPPDLVGVLLGSQGMRATGIIRFIAAGFVDSDAALAFTAEDLLASLKTAVEHSNVARLQQGLPEREARRWVLPPRYDPETHQLSWAALILPRNSPRESDGETIYYALGFGREGYVQLSIVSDVEQSDAITHMIDSFLASLVFQPNKAYVDFQPTDQRAVGGLAGAMGIESLDKARLTTSVWSADSVVSIAGCIVASIGGLALAVYAQRHGRREARRG